MDNSKIAVVLGAGPALRAAVAKCSAREGFALALMAHKVATLAPLQVENEKAGGRSLAVVVDATKPEAIASAFSKCVTRSAR